jgi:UDP-N-acetylglucosamine 2-epimerase (non-hydrolysing)/GDP/UDP-N,N'-diacetylbacillosamine 2-epimerase (hydrolysing)
VSRRRICVVTTSRADYGLLRGLMAAIKADKQLQLQVIASGMHFASRFGSTWRDIEADGIRIDHKVRMALQGESALENLKSLGTGFKGFADALSRLKPDILVLLGDRFELFAPAISAPMLQIPIAHIHGGELSEGAIDDSVRHAITKMASLHFPATEVYRRRLLAMGEQRDRVFNFGAPGLDQIHNSKLMSRREVEHELNLPPSQPIAVVTYHPVTRDSAPVDDQIGALLKAVEQSRIAAVFTGANADAHGARINARLESFCKQNPDRYKWVPHLGHRRYLSCLARLDLMLGNSSSGLTEAPSFRLPVVNIGDRQNGRVKAQNVIDVPCSIEAIASGIRRALSHRFRLSLDNMRNPYQRYRDGRASERIKNVLKAADISGDFLKKHFNEVGE